MVKIEQEYTSNTYSDSGMVMTLQLTRMVVMMAKPNMGWVKTVRAILLIGWKGERIHIALVAENLTMEDGNHKDSYIS